MVATYTEGDEPVPGYRLSSLLGWGRFGEVWKVSAPGGFEAALKIISLSNRHGVKEYRAIRLFKQVRHPNLVPLMGLWLKDKHGNFIDEEVVEESGDLQGQAAELILAMGLGDRNLSDRLKECQEQLKLPGIPGWELLDYMEQTATVLDFLHQPIHNFGQGPQAIQHCDVKPQNILIVGKATQLCDLGVARVLEDPRATAAMGSAAYISPECVSLGRPSFATDQYSLAIAYTELRTGVLPIEARSIAAAYMAHMQGKLVLSRLPRSEQHVIRKATALDPRERFADVRSMVQALEQAMREGEQRGDAIIAPLLKAPEPIADDEADLWDDLNEPRGKDSGTMVLRERPVLEEAEWEPIETIARGYAVQSPQELATPAPAATLQVEAPPRIVPSASPPTPRRRLGWALIVALAVIPVALVAGAVLQPWAGLALFQRTGKNPPPSDDPRHADRGSASDSDPSVPAGPPAGDPIVPYRRGLELLDKGEPRLALKAFDEALEIDPQQLEPRLARARANLELDNFESAIQDCNDVLAIDRRDSQAWELLARAQYRAGHFDLALQDADSALKINPMLPEPYFIRARVHSEKKQPDLAIDDLDQAIRLRPEEARYRIARTELHGQWSPEKLKQWKCRLSREIDLSSKDAQLRAEFALVWLLDGDPQRAIEDCTRSIALDAHCALAHAVRAAALAEGSRKGWSDARLDQAIDDASTAIRLDPRLAYAYYARALACIEQGVKQNQRRILDDLDRALNLDPHMAQAFRKRAEVHSILGDYDQARVDFQTADRLKAAPDQQ